MDKVNSQATLPGDEVMDLVHTVMHQFRSQQYQVLREGHDITHMESKVLGFFGRHPGGTQSDLVQHSGRDKAQLARLIKGLKERGLLLAESDEADRRNIRLRLSPEGEALLQALQGQARVLGARAVQGLSNEEQAQLAALLHRVKQNLDGQD
nr:MarR family transcriptional regulator [uncultured Roseateles sp.]